MKISNLVANHFQISTAFVPRALWPMALILTRCLRIMQLRRRHALVGLFISFMLCILIYSSIPARRTNLHKMVSLDRASQTLLNQCIAIKKRRIPDSPLTLSKFLTPVMPQLSSCSCLVVLRLPNFQILIPPPLSLERIMRKIFFSFSFLGDETAPCLGLYPLSINIKHVLNSNPFRSVCLLSVLKFPVLFESCAIKSRVGPSIKWNSWWNVRFVDAWKFAFSRTPDILKINSM